MKAPDKIYLHPDFEGSQTPSVFWGEEKRGSHPEECVEYINKDVLLEWAKKRLEEFRHIAEISNDVAADGEVNAFEELIDKLNSL